MGKIVGRKAPLTVCCVHCSHNLFSYNYVYYCIIMLWYNSMCFVCVLFHL